MGSNTIPVVDLVKTNKVCGYLVINESLDHLISNLVSHGHQIELTLEIYTRPITEEQQTGVRSIKLAKLSLK